MNAQLIIQLIISVGLPLALKLIPSLLTIWNKEKLTAEEVKAFCDLAKKNYDDYIAEAKRTTATP
jgi:hypothetical protein